MTNDHTVNKQASDLNDIVQKAAPSVHAMLSDRGKEIYFPKQGILSQSAEAKGKKINATIGEGVDDDGQPIRLKTIENQLKISPALAFPYAPSTGRPDIRAQWKTMLLKKNPSLVGKVISSPIVSCALTHGLSISGYLFVNPGDTVYLPNFYWENYDLIFQNAYQADLRYYNLFKGNGLDLDSLQEKLSENTGGKKIVLLNFPNNPTGYTPTSDEVQKIAALITQAANTNKIVVLIDDAYFGLVYENGIAVESIFSQLAGAHENILAVKLDGPTKEDYVWGFRVGFITYGIKGGTTDLYSALEMKTAGAIRGNISNVSNLSQSLLLKAYESPDYDLDKKSKFDLLKSRYIKTRQVLADNKKYSEYFKPLPFNSGYFMCIQLQAGLDGEKVRQVLLKQFETGVINMSGLLRVAFSSVSADKISELFENIFKACQIVKAEK